MKILALLALALTGCCGAVDPRYWAACEALCRDNGGVASVCQSPSTLINVTCICGNGAAFDRGTVNDALKRSAP